MSAEGSIIPGETEEDGIIRKEYVLVGDVRTFEFNRAVDGKLLPVPRIHADPSPKDRQNSALPVAGHLASIVLLDLPLWMKRILRTVYHPLARIPRSARRSPRLTIPRSRHHHTLLLLFLPPQLA